MTGPSRISRAFLAAVALTLLLPAPVPAQATSRGAETQLEMTRRQRHVVVQPGVPMERVERDAEAAAAEVAERHEQETMRRARQPVPRRPDLDYDVKSGIQSRRLNDVLRRP